MIDFKVHTAYIAEVKRSLGLPMYDASIIAVNIFSASRDKRLNPV